MAAITFAIALLGAILGVMNTWRSFDRDKIRVSVSPRWAFHSHPIEGSQTRLCIEVVNLSYLPITITQVAFEHRNRKEIFAFLPVFMDGQTMPRRLEPRASFTVFMMPGVENHEGMAEVKHAFVKTACGLVFNGTNNALKSHIKNLRKKNA